MIKLNKLSLIFTLSIIIIFSFDISSFAVSTIGENNFVPIDTQPHNILVINSSSSTDFDKNLFEGVSLSIEDNLPNYTIIQKNTLTLSDSEIASNINSIINNSENNIELIICLDEKSTAFFERYASDHFGNIPILFAYAGDYAIPIGPNMGGVFAPYNINEFLDTVLNFHKDTTQVNFLINKELRCTYFFHKIEEYIRVKSLDPNNSLDYKIINSGDLLDVIVPLGKANSLTIVYSPVKDKLTPYDPARYITPYGTMTRISDKTSNPLYGGFKSFATTFNIGSYMYDGFSIGTQIGYSAYQILNGTLSIDSLGISSLDKGPLLFINEELKSFHKLPKHIDKTVYYNTGKAVSPYAQKRLNTLYLIIIVTFLLLLFFIIRNHFRTKSLKEQEKLDSIKTNFIANVSHELRTPLNIIISTIQLFDIYSKNGDIIYTSDRAREKMKYLRGNSFRLLRLVNNIIDITRIDSGYFTINKTPLNIVDVIEEVTLSSVAYAEKKEINLIFDTYTEEIIIPIDRDRIERVILNLLSNALKFTHPYGTITVTVSNNIDFVTIVVSDTGIGIPDDKFETIFKRFRQVDGTAYNKSEGSGIGLALCKSMIEMHNGTIKVESKINEGTSFILNIPIPTEKVDDVDIFASVQNKNTDDILQVEYSDF